MFFFPVVVHVGAVFSLTTDHSALQCVTVAIHSGFVVQLS
jgi:hypothetical protein